MEKLTKDSLKTNFSTLMYNSVQNLLINQNCLNYQKLIYALKINKSLAKSAAQLYAYTEKTSDVFLI